MKKLCVLSFSLLIFAQSFPFDFFRSNELDGSEINSRIERHLTLIDTLNKLSKQGKIRSELIKNKKSACSDCSHELVKLCMKKMEHNSCLDPVVEAWKLYKSCYSDIESELFLQEFSSMVCAVSSEYVAALSARPLERKNNQQQEKPNDGHALTVSDDDVPVILPTVSLQEIFNLYIKIAKLPISEILEKLDELYYALVDLMDEYGLQAEQTWLDWLKVNWWIPPVAITCVVLVFAKKGGQKAATELLFSQIKSPKAQANHLIG